MGVIYACEKKQLFSSEIGYKFTNLLKDLFYNLKLNFIIARIKIRKHDVMPRTWLPRDVNSALAKNKALVDEVQFVLIYSVAQSKLLVKIKDVAFIYNASH